MQKIRILGAGLGALAMILASLTISVPQLALAHEGDKQTVSGQNGEGEQETQQEDQNKEDENENEIDDQDGLTEHTCPNTLVNGHLYKVGSEATVYMSSHCVLKPFRGEAVFHSRGLKFQNITTFDTLPAGVTISDKPMLPADGTLIKGHDKTVWFADHNGHRRGFVSAEVFKALGFSFEKVQEISDSDLAEIPTDDNISDSAHHPDGSLIKCGNSAAVFIVIGGEKFPFANADAFKERGHSFDHILNIDCGRFAYIMGRTISQ